MHRFLLKLFRRRRLEKDLEAELAFHRELAAAQGNTIPFGNVTSIKEQALDLWRFPWIENISRDLLYAVRSLRHSPGLVLSALLSLGLGIGANTAMFSLAVELLLSEPSVRDSSSVAYLRFGGNSHVSPKAVEFLRQSDLFQDVAGENSETFINWDDGNETRRVFAVQATKNYFTALGIPLAYGRGWTSEDTDQVAVLRYQFWRRHFNGDPAIVGRAIRLDGRPYTVVGILPETHHTLMGYGFSPDVYVPHYIESTVLAIYARLKPDMSFPQAGAALQAAAERLDREAPERWKYSRNTRATPIAGIARLQQEREVQTIALFFVALLVVVGLVLLIACVNVAGLLLARSAARKQEIAIRLAIGASRGRLLQQLLAESLLLSGSGAALGFFIALVVARGLASIPLPIPVPIQLNIQPDWRVAAYAALLAMGSTIACGLLPAWQSVKDSLVSSLHRDRRLRARRALVVAQIAVSSIVLLTGSLFVSNLLLSSSLGPGFDINRTLRAEVHLPPAAYKDSKRIVPFVEQALLELRAVPGIEVAAAARIIPFTDSTRFGMDLTFADNGEKRNASFHWNAVTSDYFQAMSIPILSGRTFLARESDSVKVVILNTEFVKRFLGERNPLGVVMRWGDDNASYQIVGVVRPTRNLTIGEGDLPQLYQPVQQITTRPRIQFVLRSSTPPAAQIQAVRQALRRVEPSAGLEVATLFSSIGLAFLPSQVGAILMGSLGLLGLLLAAIGLYGVLAYAVARRTRELGIRMALGASRREISRTVLRESAILLALGIFIGLGIGVFVTQPLSTFLVPELSASNPASFGVVIAVFVATGLLATMGPMRRAIRIDPMRCLRYE